MVATFPSRLRAEKRLEGKTFSDGKSSLGIIWLNDDDGELVDSFQPGLYTEFEQRRNLPASSTGETKA